MKTKAKKTRTMQALAALIAVAIFLLPVARATPLFSKEGVSSPGNEFSLENKDTSILEKENTSLRTALSPKGLEGALTAPRSQVYSCAAAQVYCCTAYLLQAFIGAIMLFIGFVGMIIFGAILLLVAVVGGIIDWIIVFAGSLITGLSDFPWVWETLLVAAAGSLLVIMAVSGALTLVSLINIIIGVIVGAIVGFFIGLPFFIVGAIPGAIIFGIIFGLIFAIFSIPPLVIGICILLVDFFLWIFCFGLAIVAIIVWLIPYASVFWGAAIIWLILGLFAGTVADLGQLLILISNTVYGVCLLFLSILFLLFSLCFAYGLLLLLGPVNLLIAVVSSVLGIFSLFFCGFLAVICFFFLGFITFLTQCLTWFWNSVIVTLFDLGMGLGGICALNAPASIVLGLVGVLMLVLGGLLALTGFGLPLGIPMLIFGIIMMLTGLIPGILTSIYTVFVQFPIVQNLLALCIVVVVLLLDATYGVGWAILIFFELIAYFGDIGVGLLNIGAWFFWTCCTSFLCACALAPWGIALPSWCASIPFLPCYAFGFVMDLATWCFLILQDTLYYLWQFFFQSSMD